MNSVLFPGHPLGNLGLILFILCLSDLCDVVLSANTYPIIRTSPLVFVRVCEVTAITGTYCAQRNVTSLWEQERQCTCNVILRLVRLTTVAVKSNKYETLQMCAFILALVN